MNAFLTMGDMSPKMAQGADTLELNGMGDDGVLGDASVRVMADEAVLDMGAFYDDWLFYIKKNKVTFGVVAGVSVLAIVGLIVWKMRKG